MSTEKAEEARPADQPTTDGQAPSSVVKWLTKFLADHGNSASAVLQPIGRTGTRITLVGADGVLGDEVVKDLSTAKAVVERFPEITLSEWTRDLTAEVTPREGHWKKMAGWVANQTKGFPKPRAEVR